MKQSMKTLSLALLLGLIAPAFAQFTTPPDQLVAVLKSSTATMEEKFQACRQLAVVGNKDCVSPLAALLADEKLAHMARYALEPIPDPSVDDALRDALGKLKGKPQVGVIISIGVRQDARAVDALVSLLKDGDPMIAQAAARSLGKIGTVEAARGISAALAATPKENQLAFCEGLFRCAEALLKAGKTPEAVAVYDAMAARTEPHQVRAGGVRGAILARGEQGVALLKESLKNGEYLIFAAACSTSMELPGKPVTLALAEALPQVPNDYRLLILHALGKRQDATALEAVAGQTKPPTSALRLQAIRTIGEIGSPAGAKVLTELMADADKEVASLATETFASLRGKEIDDMFIAMFNASNTDQRLAGLELIGRRRMTGCVPALFKAAADPDAKIRPAAIRKLGELAAVTDLDAIIAIFTRAEGAEQDAAEAAISAVAQKADKPEACAAKVVALLSDPKPARKVATLRILSTLGGNDALIGIRSVLKEANADAQVRSTAIRSLGNWKAADAAPDLLDLAKNAADAKEKVLGLRSYLGLTSRNEIPQENRLAMAREASTLITRVEEKRLLLGALGNIRMPESVQMLAPYLDDAATREEAGTALVNVAEQLLKTGANKKVSAELIAPLDKVAKTTTNEKLKGKAAGLVGIARSKAK